MKLITLKIRNFLSWGNTDVLINLDKYNNKKLLISGDNKQGKSTIVDAISFALFGKTIRPIKKEDYINYINKKNMRVELIFENVVNETMRVVRTQKSLNYSIDENWYFADDDDPIEKLSTKQLTLEKICNDYYGFTYDEFKNSIALTTFNSKIMEQGKDDKRKFFENMFNITSIRLIKNILVEQYNLIKSNKHNIENNLNSDQSIITVILENINKIKKIKTNIQKEADKTITEYNNKIKTNEDNILTLSNKYTELTNKYEKLLISYNKKEKRYNKLKHNVSFLNDREKYLNSNTNKVCSQCGQEITKEHTHIMIEKIKENTNEFNKKIDNINIKQHKNELDTLHTNIINLKNDINELHSKNREYSNLIKVTNKNIKQQLKDLDLKDNEQKLNKIKNKIAKNKQELTKLNYDITKYEFLLNECVNDEGLRHFILSYYINYINTMLQENVNKLNLEFDLLMDNSMNIEIKKLDMNINYWGLSLGERSLLNTIILFVIVKLRKLINTNFINLLIIDEFLDTGLSPESIELALNLINELFEDTSIIMISHKLSDQYDYFDNILQIKKVGSFSQIDYIK